MTLTALPVRPSVQNARASAEFHQLTAGATALAPRREAPRREAPRTSAPHVRAVPDAPQRASAAAEARGFVLYVGLGEDAAASDQIELARLVRELRTLTARLAPSAETHAAVALAPTGVGGRDVDVVRRALGDPAVQPPVPETNPGIVIDLTRQRVAIGDDIAPLTYKEFELLQYIVAREGSTVDRESIIAALWPDEGDADRPNARTIDVHVRRLRSKLGEYSSIIRTVRGAGYRFDRHADVTVFLQAPSPDAF